MSIFRCCGTPSSQEGESNGKAGSERGSSDELKQVAQELIRRLDGAEEVNNHLEVVAPANPP